MVHNGTKIIGRNLKTEFKFKTFLRLVFYFHTNLFSDLKCL